MPPLHGCLPYAPRRRRRESYDNSSSIVYRFHLGVSFNKQMLGYFSAVLLSGVLSACQRAPQTNSVHEGRARDIPSVARDLSQDEAAGGHTLRRHVGRSNSELRNRLNHEPDISAASSYTDRETAEHVVGAVIEEAQARIERWLDRPGGHPNLVLDYRGDSSHPIGSTLHRGETAARPCSDAIVVLRWDGDRRYHVLTSYPECR